MNISEINRKLIGKKEKKEEIILKKGRKKVKRRE